MTGLANKKNFRDLWDGFRVSNVALADIKIAGFILQHWFSKEPVSAASIGLPSSAELFALSLLVDLSASFVILNTEPASLACRLRVSELTDIASRAGYEGRFLITDLTLPGRWAQLLAAVTLKRVGLVGLDGRWAVSQQKFWEDLATFIDASKAVVYVRGALDFEHPQISIDLFKSMQLQSTIEVIGATPSSLWFSSKRDAPVLIEMLSSSCLFDCSLQRAGEIAQRTIIVRNDWLPDVVDSEGRFIRKHYTATSEVDAGLDFAAGWASPESDGRWSEGSEATAIIALPSGVFKVKRLSITGNGWVPPNNPLQWVELGIGGGSKSRAELQFTDGNEIKSAVLEVSPSDIINNRITLKIKVRNPGRPSDFGDPDSRLLGFKIRALDLFT